MNNDCVRAYHVPFHDVLILSHDKSGPLLLSSRLPSWKLVKLMRTFFWVICVQTGVTNEPELHRVEDLIAGFRIYQIKPFRKMIIPPQDSRNTYPCRLVKYIQGRNNFVKDLGIHRYTRKMS